MLKLIFKLFVVLSVAPHAFALGRGSGQSDRQNGAALSQQTEDAIRLLEKELGLKATRQNGAKGRISARFNEGPLLNEVELFVLGSLAESLETEGKSATERQAFFREVLLPTNVQRVGLQDADQDGTSLITTRKGVIFLRKQGEDLEVKAAIVQSIERPQGQKIHFQMNLKETAHEPTPSWLEPTASEGAA